MMKNSILFFAFVSALFVGGFFGGCKKYVNDTLTKRKFNKYISGTWKMTKYEVDGIDSLQYFTFYGNDEFVIDKDKIMIKGTIYDYELHVLHGNNTIQTYYPFYSVDKYIDTIIGVDTTFLGRWGNYYSIWKIDNLTDNEMKISQEFNSLDYQNIIIQQHKITCVKIEK